METIGDQKEVLFDSYLERAVVESSSHCVSDSFYGAGWSISADFFIIVCFSVWGTFPCYLPHFGERPVIIC